MTLIKSISGIRGTTGGKPGTGFTPVDIVECTASYAQIVKENNAPNKIVVGRDGRMTGELVNALVVSTLMSMGLDVIDIGLSTTPTVEMAVKKLNAGAGIILTASHNPKEWNALKFLDQNGDFISEATGTKVLDYIKEGRAVFADLEGIGNYEMNNSMIDYHISRILELNYIQTEKINLKKFKVVVDCINSTGAISVLPLLKKLGCEVIAINDNITGDFAHNPEPLPEYLTELAAKVVENNADMGIVVDPDVDRLAFVCADGTMFGEEYTLVAAADFILRKKKGNTVSNLSSSRALKDITLMHGGNYFPAKVGEVNVVDKMKMVNAVIGGEGNGGVILPDLHYGRDALAGIALILSLLAEDNISLKQLKKTYPEYVISKNKINIPQNISPDDILKMIVLKYSTEEINTEDGLKIDFADGWVQLRKSNTEPILRVYSESKSEDRANEMAKMLITDVEKLINN